ncbi:MAG: hypothetical protein K2Q06_10620 [Parvularculaceae bacterium]|nr:hypothetical protein [Parvularculaceae bacterium]
MTLFETRIWRAMIEDPQTLNADIAAAAKAFASDDAAGEAWCRENAYPGYTSYGSLEDLPTRATCFSVLKRRLDREVAAFAEDLAFDLGRGRLSLDNLWVNRLNPGGFHAGHIHPYSVISGTYYVNAPKGAASLKFEDPRHAMMMAAPPRREDAPEALRPFVYVEPAPGLIVLWESFLRHEVPRNLSRRPRVSVSFNYRWRGAT